MRPWMVAAMLAEIIGAGGAPVGAEMPPGAPAVIRRLDREPTAVLEEARFELDVRGTVFQLDVYLGPAAGGFHGFASSVGGGMVRAWFDPAHDGWVATTPDGLVRTFGARAPGGVAAAEEWRLTRIEDEQGNWLALSPPS